MATDFEACLAESGTVAFRVAFRLLRSREDAEDVSQEALIRAMERFDSLRDRNRFRAWLVRMAWRLAIDRRRSDWRRAGRDTHIISPVTVDADAERELIERERAAHLQAAVEQLPDKLRTPFVLGNVEGRSFDEIAALLQVPPGTVKSRAFQARKRLRRTLLKTGVVLGLVAWASVVVGLRFVDRTSVPAIEVPQALTASTEVAPMFVQPGAPRTAVRTPAVTPAPVPRVSTVVTVPTIEIPLVVISPVKIPVVQVPVVETATPNVPSVVMEKNR